MQLICSVYISVLSFCEGYTQKCPRGDEAINESDNVRKNHDCKI